MEQLIDQLVEKVGIDRSVAEQVSKFIQEHMHEIPGWLGQAGLSGLADKLPGGLGDLLGGDDG
jgi:hypothetical protein